MCVCVCVCVRVCVCMRVCVPKAPSYNSIEPLNYLGLGIEFIDQSVISNYISYKRAQAQCF